MDITDVSVFAITALFAAYILACSVHCGIALLRVWRFAPSTPAQLTPWWEVTNLFLAAGVLAFVFTFSGGMSQIGNALFIATLVGALALLCRVGLLLFLRYRRIAEGVNAPNIIFLIASFVTPLSLIAMGFYLLGDTSFWLQPAGWVALLAATSGLAATGLSLAVRGHDLTKPLRTTVLVCMVIWLLLIASLPLLFMGPIYSRLLGQGAQLLPIYGGAALLGVAVFTWLRQANKLWVIAIITMLGIPLLFTGMQMPYLSYPSFLLQDTYNIGNVKDMTAIVILALLPLVGIGIATVVNAVRQRLIPRLP